MDDNKTFTRHVFTRTITYAVTFPAEAGVPVIDALHIIQLNPDDYRVDDTQLEHDHTSRGIRHPFPVQV